jgi:hypothetical protein
VTDTRAEKAKDEKLRALVTGGVLKSCQVLRAKVSDTLVIILTAIKG